MGAVGVILIILLSGENAASSKSAATLITAAATMTSLAITITAYVVNYAVDLQ
jgi:hypothetical protein